MLVLVLNLVILFLWMILDSSGCLLSQEFKGAKQPSCFSNLWLTSQVPQNGEVGGGGEARERQGCRAFLSAAFSSLQLSKEILNCRNEVSLLLCAKKGRGVQLLSCSLCNRQLKKSNKRNHSTRMGKSNSRCWRAAFPAFQVPTGLTPPLMLADLVAP